MFPSRIPSQHLFSPIELWSHGPNGRWKFPTKKTSKTLLGWDYETLLTPQKACPRKKPKSRNTGKPGLGRAAQAAEDGLYAGPAVFRWDGEVMGIS